MYTKIFIFIIYIIPYIDIILYHQNTMKMRKFFISRIDYWNYLFWLLDCNNPEQEFIKLNQKLLYC